MSDQEFQYLETTISALGVQSGTMRRWAERHMNCVELVVEGRKR